MFMILMIDRTAESICAIPDEAADDNTVHRVVKLLCDIPQKHGDGEADNLADRVASPHVYRLKQFHLHAFSL